MVTHPVPDDNARVRTSVGVLRAAIGGALASVLLAIWALPASACSPPFEPSIEALGPDQVVVVGTTGARVANGRLFHVERWFNGGLPTTPIVIGFKEGEPIGDCSYPVAAGTHLIIAPDRLENGSLYADLATLQADPDSGAGRAYLAEAIALFGPGVAPEPAEERPADAGMAVVLPVLIGLVAIGALAGVAFVVAGRSGRRTRPGG